MFVNYEQWIANAKPITIIIKMHKTELEFDRIENNFAVFYDLEPESDFSLRIPTLYEQGTISLKITGTGEYFISENDEGELSFVGRQGNDVLYMELESDGDETNFGTYYLMNLHEFVGQANEYAN